MNKLDLLQSFLSINLANISLWGFVLNMVLSGVLAMAIGHMYVRYGKSLSNRKSFSKNFVMLTMTTMLIITIVQSSLALSLGLIGALSIVRFRAAIKEPEELTYLFLSIAVGLGLGANQRLITIISFITIISVVWIRHLVNRKKEGGEWERKMYMTVTTHNPGNLSLKNISNIIDENCTSSRIKRTDKSDALYEACFIVDFKDKNSLQTIEDSISDLDKSIVIKFLDYSI